MGHRRRQCARPQRRAHTGHVSLVTLAMQVVKPELFDEPRSGNSVMILRRLAFAFRKQDWFTVMVEIIIVVLGVFIGLQVNNWNEARQHQNSEAKYLDRFADEIEMTIAQIRDERAFSQDAVGTIENFTAQLFRSSATDEELVSAANDFLTTGALFANFKPNRTTFDDLITTGNFDIIGDETIQRSLIGLHARYDDAESTIEGNIAWIQQGEDRIYYQFDAFRHDARTQALFDSATQEALAEDIRNNRYLLRRHAAFHYWLKVRTIQLYDEVEPLAQAVLELIRAEQGLNH